jgi:hypothetical protein
MKNFFNDISHDERKRILEMHESATKKNYIFEQNTQTSTGTTGGLNQKPSIAPSSNKPQGPAKIYKQIDIATFNTKFGECWNNTDSGRDFANQKVRVMSLDDKEAQNKIFNNQRLRVALFNVINQYYLNSLTKPMNSEALESLWESIKKYPITYDFVDSNTNKTTTTKSNVGESIQKVYANEGQMKKEYLNTFNCALKSVQGNL